MAKNTLLEQYLEQYLESIGLDAPNQPDPIIPPIVVSPPTIPVTPPTAGTQGTAGHDHMVGTAGNDVMSSLGDADTVAGKAGNDKLDGGVGDDKMWGGSGDDTVEGGDGNDMVTGGFGSDVVNGGAGDDMIFSRSDAGEPEINNLDANGIYNPDPIPTQVHPEQPYDNSDDVLTGGTGADTFRFEFLINGREQLIDDLSKGKEWGRISDAPYGEVDWLKVTDYSNNFHTHYMESMGDDVITDFSKAEGDKIEVSGHTLMIGDDEHDVNWNGGTIHYGTDAGGSYSQFGFIAMQGGGGHAGDKIGTLKVYGDRVEMSDIALDRHGTYGAYVYGDEWPRQWEDDGVLPGNQSTGGHHLEPLLVAGTGDLDLL